MELFLRTFSKNLENPPLCHFQTGGFKAISRLHCSLKMNKMVNVKRKSAFEHTQNVRIHIILHMRKVSPVHLLSTETFKSI